MMRSNHSHLTLAIAMTSICGLQSFHFDPDEPPAAPPAPNPAPSVQALREEFSRLQTEGTTLIETATRENRELTQDEQTANDRRFTRMTAIKRLIDDQERFATLSIAPASGGARRQTPTDHPGRDQFDRSEGNPGGGDDDDGEPFKLTDGERRKFSREVREYAVSGTEGPIAKKFATITSATNGGILMPKSVLAPLVPTSMNAFRAAFAFYGKKPIETTTTEDLDQGVMDATAGGTLAENATTNTENGDVSDGMDLSVTTYESGSTWFSNKQLRANDFDLLESTVPNLRYQKELGLESAIAAGLIADSDIDQIVPTASISTISYDNLVDLDMALPSRFDSMKAIVLGRACYAAARKLKGDDGHPLLIADPQRNGLAFFNNTPVMKCDYLEAFGANKVVGVIFSLMGFGLRDVTVEELARYINQPARRAQTGLCLFAWHGFDWATEAVAKLKCPAS